MMSSNAYNIASCLETGAFTLHDLLATMLHVELVPRDGVDNYLYAGLREMVQSGWVRWEYHPDYGNAPAQIPEAFNSVQFDKDWRRCTTKGPLQEGVPNAANPTILFEATDALDAELDRPEYQNSSGPEKGGGLEKGPETITRDVSKGDARQYTEDVSEVRRVGTYSNPP